MAASSKAPPGHFSILYFAAASTFTGKSSEHLPAPVRARELFHVLEQRYPDFTGKVLGSCAVTVNLDYVDMGEDEGDEAGDRDKMIVEGDEVAIIPPVSSG
ncbi:similar to molybdopterin synthase small subunit CnxG [Plenodomus lingam JN3]|uniref:Molybdopterin synthase sulfur carrier subunit n=1 Tax=Leptosphaeria maculans (strain JN3 / isolate v23.1.3 / race Av1-4-5-6-7-8) TaxID=985895 RepID=E4ZK00_LEPMJ|nr:similar to molybdopterin synthase small subunit CnxG [Plenodomus lingam JN3]CBX91435.1 similar to molybdopterin synthase small subunit CnxG [Plenodomus lingam JN3]